MSRLTFLGLLAACLIITAPLELLLHTGVYRRWRRLALALAPTAILFCAWDVYAIRAGHWEYNPSYILGWRLPGRLPVEELLFFLITPTCAILTLEAVRRRKPHWPIGDEPPREDRPGVRCAASRRQGRAERETQ
ncbi:MAG: lycopene cyclase domain-containing protein [Frankiaceae bacterium]|jgi:lycopene cyclase domain-containing protein|nr:lycopene cyclase domain-containing protein [Frankiaceae bacterium]